MLALDEQVSIGRVACVLGVHHSALTRRAQPGRLPATKVGDVWVTTLRRVLNAESTRRGSRGPAPRPLLDRMRKLLDADGAGTAHEQA